MRKLLIGLSILICFLANGQNPNTEYEKFRLFDFYQNQEFNFDTVIFDTVINNGFEFIISPLDSIEYFSTLNNYYQNLDFTGIEMYTPNARNLEKLAIQNDSLIRSSDSSFILIKKDTSYIIPRYTKEIGEGVGKSMAEKIYIGYIPKVSLYVFWVEGYEEGHFYSINRNSNKSMNFNGFPKYSPSRKFLLSSYYDVEIGYFENGFRIYTINGDSIKQVLSYENYDPDDQWGPEGMIWKNDTTLYMIRICFDYDRKPYKLRTIQKLIIKNTSR